MLRTILIGLDGSPFSRNAIEFGIELARGRDVLLVGLGVVDEPAITRPTPVPLGGGAFKGESDRTRLEEARHRVEQLLERFALRCGEAGVASKLLEDTGSPAEKILLEAQRYDAVMLGRETYFSFQTQREPDDTLEQVVKNCPRPVVVVPEDASPGRSIVIAYDGSLQAARAVQDFQGLREGLPSDRTVHVLSVGPDRLEAAKHAERAVDFLSFHQIRAQSHHLECTGAAGETLVKKARELDAGLLVMGAYGKRTLREFVFGSVTKHVLRNAPCPVFVTH